MKDKQLAYRKKSLGPNVTHKIKNKQEKKRTITWIHHSCETGLQNKIRNWQCFVQVTRSFRIHASLLLF